MNQAELEQIGFMRVERDDRLLDVFTKETLEKGVELWERWNEETIEIVRNHAGKQTQFVLDRAMVESALADNKTLILESSQ